MLRTDEKLPGLEVGSGITEDAGDVFADAVGLVPITDTAERAYINCLLDRVKQGELSMYALSARCRTVGVLCYRVLDGDAELVFGHVLDGGAEAYFLESAVLDLYGKGVHTVRSNFNWPEPRSFIKGATAMGFTMTDRMSMCRSPGPSTPACEGFEIVPWRDGYAESVCGIMYRDQSPADVPVYPMFSRPEGARTLLESVIQDRHGRFLRELSYVALADRKLVGFLISTLLTDGSVLILDLGVDRDYRRRGVGSALLDGLIGDAYAMGKDQIVLAVTSNNYDAIRLYERKGFKVNGYFRQHVHSRITPGACTPNP